MAVFALGAWAWYLSPWWSTVLSGHQCEHTLFSSTHARIQARSQAQKWAVGLCVDLVLVVLGQSTAIYLL